MKKKIAVSITLAVGLLAMFAWLFIREESKLALDDVAIDSTPGNAVPEQIDPTPSLPPTAPVTPKLTYPTPIVTVSGSIVGRVFDQHFEAGPVGVDGHDPGFDFLPASDSAGHRNA